MDEKEYNDPIKRLKKASDVSDRMLIYEDKKIEEITNGLKRMEHKINKLISMLTAHDYSCKERDEKK